MGINKLWVSYQGNHIFVVGPKRLNEIFSNPLMRCSDDYVLKTLGMLSDRYGVSMGLPIDGSSKMTKILGEGIVLREIIDKRNPPHEDKIGLVKKVLRLNARCKKLGVPRDNVSIELKDYTGLGELMRDYESHVLLLNASLEPESFESDIGIHRPAGIGSHKK